MTTPSPPSTHAELLDTLLGTTGRGTALLEAFGDMPTLAQQLDAAPLTQRQRERLRAAFSLRFACEPVRPRIKNPADAFTHVQDLQLATQEHLVVLVLNTRNDMIHRADVYQGSLNSSFIRLAEIFRQAIIRNGASIVVVHNHPSGDPSPSSEDIALTRALVELGKQLSIEVLDHIVIGHSRLVSLRERGLGFTAIGYESQPHV